MIPARSSNWLYALYPSTPFQSGLHGPVCRTSSSHIHRPCRTSSSNGHGHISDTDVVLLHNPPLAGSPVVTPDCLFPFALKFWFRQRLKGFFKWQGGEVEAYDAYFSLSACLHNTSESCSFVKSISLRFFCICCFSFYKSKEIRRLSFISPQTHFLEQYPLLKSHRIFSVVAIRVL